MPRVTVFYGLYGSGKSEVAINYAMALLGRGCGVTVVDLDVVTPYFRVRDASESLRKKGIRVLAPADKMQYADLPVLPETVRRVMKTGEGQVVVDVGGDPTGAKVLGGLRDAVPDGSEVFFVVNFRRPFSRTPEEARRSLELVSQSAGIQPTGIVANTHLGYLTEVSHVKDGFRLALELGRKTGLPVRMCAVPSWLRESEAEIFAFTGETPVLWIQRFLLPPWEPPWEDAAW
ncbi:MAG: hypothetical protein IMF26_02220 [Candidatus Fermentithermobacillus carboniphilus]|uniref:CobQ/CobB/MinD/ParA nucleotide binding domain-containing protein n=1 Tax=Candidatus Fermentithermobacillus carboniphilus TaxID=3085328 RepID=A0AAT9LGE8_9FIRM|nr:MAG: hypothetical protein IMF26_02220 [Candidatus Fermentithermobacillus carboniphilus]